MGQAVSNWTRSSVLLMMAGIALVVAGLYFITLRPALLPEDIRFMAVPEEQLGEVRPGLEAWLTQVFRVMGGYVLATGVLAMTLAATAYRTHQKGSGVGVLVGGLASIGLMVFVNFTLDSEWHHGGRGMARIGWDQADAAWRLMGWISVSILMALVWGHAIPASATEVAHLETPDQPLAPLVDCGVLHAGGSCPSLSCTGCLALEVSIPPVGSPILSMRPDPEVVWPEDRSVPPGRRPPWTHGPCRSFTNPLPIKLLEQEFQHEPFIPLPNEDRRGRSAVRRHSRLRRLGSERGPKRG